MKCEGAAYLLFHPDRSKLKNQIRKLLTWVQDMHWPATLNVRQLLVLFGMEIILSVKKYLSPIQMIQFGVIIWILSKIHSPRLTESKDELVATVQNSNEDGAAISALELMYDKRS